MQQDQGNASSKRLSMLEKLTASPTADSFAWYALALEHRGIGNIEKALESFRTLRTRDPAYLPMYFVCGTMLRAEGRLEEAREWLRTGLALAQECKNRKVQGELEDALSSLDLE